MLTVALAKLAAIVICVALSTVKTVPIALSSSSCNTSPTANVWTMQDWSDMNGSSSSYVAYFWAGKPGRQKFGTYRGSGTADGPYVFTGFRPAIVMVKRYDGGSDNWMIIDDTRDKYNICKNQLYPNLVDKIHLSNIHKSSL